MILSGGMWTKLELFFNPNMAATILNIIVCPSTNENKWFGIMRNFTGMSVYIFFGGRTVQQFGESSMKYKLKSI